MGGESGTFGIAEWEPEGKACPSTDAGYREYPEVVYRTPTRLVRECEDAFDAGLVLAALTLVVTIPDVCANIAGNDYRGWCRKYLSLAEGGGKMSDEREGNRQSDEVEGGLVTIGERGIFTVSDLYQLRCAVVHSASSVIEGKGSGYSPYKSIGVCILGDANKIVASYGHTATGTVALTDCAYDCVVVLEGLISCIAKGVSKFVQDNPNLDREFDSGGMCLRRGVVDYRPASVSTF